MADRPPRDPCVDAWMPGTKASSLTPKHGIKTPPAEDWNLEEEIRRFGSRGLKEWFPHHYCTILFSR